MNGSGYLSTMGNSIAFQELGSGDITSSETSGNSAGAAADGYGDDFDSGNTEIIITQNAQTIGGETVFTLRALGRRRNVLRCRFRKQHTNQRRHEL